MKFYASKANQTERASKIFWSKVFWSKMFRAMI